ncbi:glycosyltransferase family 2 protein [Paracoccus denitrificans]|jgi:cellulose synthase/poly-beta-1,6-N-acetylglucosamine synthase-like glycosyltransferase|uniref:General secretory system II, protein E domain protein n=1 Tax=Paracoccus denitrificans (strain Pd 1222) TaxID=318586 RepID=A1B414_PARDP|nr:glycosyltransferase family 2 protein [Paracoccus denitrificans]ABL70258.1 General secretory system II, protein E domain protein [Paracoccus denitrificans PD1222]MBB4627166.1 cellulose synthase/poly-beta-1,6-N-acetylglucosamine synthase-like glycosyltransferase [Paracoccus denitrificans]MCU7428061.1 glycosyltransferase [Paracoccus denitrificans]QAR25609.1 glycosyltransferase [Paracoccus denitrificans]UPV94507.1 glycosyltransferase [Paracoccus denitrificans]
MARIVPIRPFEGIPVLAALPDPAETVVSARDLRPLGQILIEDGAVDPRNLFKALVMRQRQSARLGEILLANGWVREEALIRALSRQWRASVLDLKALPPDPRLVDAMGAQLCLAEGAVPWRRVGGVTFIATARPEGFQALQDRLPQDFGAVRMLLCSENAAREAILALRRTALIRQAETRVPAHESCRTRNERRFGRIAVILIAATVLGLLLAPIAVIALLTGWTVLTLIASAALKLLSFAAILRRHRRDRTKAEAMARDAIPPPEMTAPLPVISVMVPLFAEADIAEKLIGRLSRLDYPRELMDILIVVEETDSVTCAALEDARLPRWLRVVKVPDGPVRTKPRALNYALNFCRGSIIGVWDAEDRPEPGQLLKVARGFHFAPPEVVCLQGVLDYYNPRTNWLARAFTIEYASWFRGTLAGAAALDLVVPLGGTTLFFRREALEEVGAWDAWNVTEDADLGVRLTRRGYRTRMLDTVTHEEANCRLIPWVKQRSRWLKGFAMTWGVHMRDPVALWRDLGARRFIGLQVQLFASVSQYLLAPVLWSFWLLSLGLPHPMRGMLSGMLGGNAIAILFTLFVASELLNIAIGLWAVRGRGHRHLLPWVPTLHLYFPLGCLAAWKAIYEVVAKPFYWDKTQHGIFEAGQEEAPEPAPIAPGRLIPLRKVADLHPLALIADPAMPAPRSKRNWAFLRGKRLTA